MKRHGRSLLVALAVGALGTAPLAGQTLGVRGGVSIATWGGSDAPDEASSRTALNVGANVTFPVAPNLGIQVGGVYAQKGATFTETDPDVGTVEATAKFDYIEVPVLLRIAVPTAGTISPHFVVGGAVAFEAGCEVEGSAAGITVTFDCSDFGLDTKSIDFGGVAGAGLSVGTAGPLSITLDVLYNLGLSSFVDDSTEDVDVKNRAFSILAGVSFGIG